MYSDRSEAARTLMELGADAGVKDSDGQLCITAMIDKMTSVVNMGRMVTDPNESSYCSTCSNCVVCPDNVLVVVIEWVLYVVIL